jgi:hypothetical protein
MPEELQPLMSVTCAVLLVVGALLVALIIYGCLYISSRSKSRSEREDES